MTLIIGKRCMIGLFKSSLRHFNRSPSFIYPAVLLHFLPALCSKKVTVASLISCIGI